MVAKFTCGCTFVIYLMVLFTWYVVSVIVTKIGNVTHSGLFSVNRVKVGGLKFGLPRQTKYNNSVVAIHR